TKSNFAARPAMIYLPPAALSEMPPTLPVMELMAGQPGSPSRLIDAGNIAAMMDSYAAKHDGLAPIVIAPDQNGEVSHN
ncbi:MFS transporter, partial [Fusicatenibacter saccharivorans]|nr:MFS transporter [Fusicatenibacter saccharivorans]